MLLDNASVCPDREDLRRFLLGQVSDREIDELERHLARCARCLQCVQELDLADTLAEALQAQARIAPVSTDEQVESMIRRLQEQAQATTDEERDVDLPSAGAEVEGSALRDTSAETYRILQPPLQAGEIGRLGVYRVLGVLGSGGMGIVFRAEDPRLGRLVAVKVLRPVFLDSSAVRQRFVREAQTAAAVEHEHVVHINEIGEDHGIPFVAMPLLQGESLDARIRREVQLPIAEVLRIGREIAEGLAAAQDRGLIHRDIKPANIWLEGGRGKVKLLDFGLARLETDSGQVTQTGFVVGTPAFMAPEQAQGEAVDGRADLFSLGCVLYRMTTGRLPFGGASTMQVLHALANQEPTPARQLNAELIPALAAFIHQLLSKDPAGRPASAREVAEMLAALERNEPIAPPTSLTLARPVSPPTIPRRRSHRLLGKLALLGLLVSLGLAASLFGPPLWRVGAGRSELAIETDEDVLVVLRQHGQRVQSRHAEKSQSFEVPAGDYEAEIQKIPGGAVLSRHRLHLVGGSKVVMSAKTGIGAAAGSPEDRILSVGVLDGGNPRVAGVAFSSDGRLLAIANHSKTMVWDVTRGKEGVVLDNKLGDFFSIAVRRDGTQLASGGWHEVRAWDLRSGRLLWRRGIPGEVLSMAYSPDGKRLLSASVDWWAGGTNGIQGHVKTWRADTGAEQISYARDAKIYCQARYSPDGKWVAAGELLWDAVQKRPLPDAVVRVWQASSGKPYQQLPCPRFGELYALAFSPDSQLLAIGAAGEIMRLWELKKGAKATPPRTLEEMARQMARLWEGKSWQELPSLSVPGQVGTIAFSPDGRWLLSGSGGSHDVRIWDSDTRKLVRVLRHDPDKIGPSAFSPDGRLVATNNAGQVKVWDLTQLPDDQPSTPEAP